MIGQKERARPCANTDKPKENTDSFLPSEYTIDCDCLQYAGVLYYAVDDRGRKFQHYLYNSIYEITRLEDAL